MNNGFYGKIHRYKLVGFDYASFNWLSAQKNASEAIRTLIHSEMVRLNKGGRPFKRHIEVLEIEQQGGDHAV